jgi:hypothetical protein
MAPLVEVTLLLDQNDADKLVDLAGGDAHVNQYAAEMIRNLHTDPQDLNENTYIEQVLSEAQSLIDLYG